jgi:hypothetical protein
LGQFEWGASDGVVREQRAREDHLRALRPVIAVEAAEISAVHEQASRRRDVVLGRVHLKWRWKLAQVPLGAPARCKQGADPSAER